MFRKPKFEIYKDARGYFRWRLKAGNGEIVAASEAYTRRQSALISVNAIKRLAPLAEVVDLTQVSTYR